ncbi:MAG: YhjD/YihY/BrkB family envelope integrity protein [Desulfococcaceae bacterium]
MKSIHETIAEAGQFVHTDIWRIRTDRLPPFRAFFVKHFRIFLTAVALFRENHAVLRASALTFYTVLSIVPVLALAFGIAEGFGFEKILEQELLSSFPAQEAVIANGIAYAGKLLENTRGGLIAGIGVAVLFWTVIKVLGHIEVSLNAIWSIQNSRTIGRKLGDYLAIMIIAPVLVIISGSVTVYIRTQIIMITQKIELLDMFSRFIFFCLKLLPFGLVWLLFSLIYILMPNGKVRLLSGISAGIIGGTVYQITQWIYIHFQIGVAGYNAIYGSFAALPLFLVWLQLSWLIVLFGAAVSAAHQNALRYEYAPDCRNISASFRRLISLQITHRIVRNFAEGESPVTAKDISALLEIPHVLAEGIIADLLECGIVSAVKIRGKNEDAAYQPARDIQSLSVFYVISALDRKGKDDIPHAQTETVKILSEAMGEFGRLMEKSPKNLLLRDI